MMFTFLPGLKGSTYGSSALLLTVITSISRVCERRRAQYLLVRALVAKEKRKEVFWEAAGKGTHADFAKAVCSLRINPSIATYYSLFSKITI